eukprot:8044558-Karenia_brevis.AAC.1
MERHEKEWRDKKPGRWMFAEQEPSKGGRSPLFPSGASVPADQASSSSKSKTKKPSWYIKGGRSPGRSR